jgi:uncharacterized protein YkwD
MGRLRALVVAAVVAASGIVVGVVPLAPPAAPAGAVVNPTPTIDPTNRASVLAAYQTSLVEARAVPVGWTGSTSPCVKGAESAASVTATRAAYNFYRGLVGLPAVTINETKNDQARAAALMMQANNQINHFPPDNWNCWTQQGDTAAASSNLSQGLTGASAIDAYMADFGGGNYFAGHRRTMLHPSITNIGTGSTTGFNALRVYDDVLGPRPVGPTWIRWPNAGFVPKRALRPFTFAGSTVLFSLSNNAMPSANYDDAVVTVKVGSTTLAVVVHDEVENYGDDTLTFDVTVPAGYDTSDADVRFDISVSGLKTDGGAAIPNQSWSSTAIVNASAPTAPAAPTGVSATAGNAQAVVSWTAPANGGSAITGYKVTPYVGATAQTVRTFTTAATTQVITGLTNGTAYTFRVQAVNAIGTGALSAASTAVTPTAPSTPYAPYNSWSHLVDQVYRQMIGRLPTAGERSQWVATLQSGTSSPGDLVANLRQSAHHRTVVDQVTRLYRAYFLRIPDRGGLEYWIAQRLAGKSLLSISAFFARSSEFVELYGDKTNREFVELIYENILGRPGEPDGVTYWTNEITSGRRGRGEVMIGFSEAAEYRADQASEVTVSVLSILWLDRAPSIEEFADGVEALDGGQSVADYADTLLPHAAVLP